MDAKVAELATQLQSKLRTLFNTARYKASGQLGGSVSVTYTPSTPEKLPVIFVEFAIQGKIIDIKKIFWSKMGNVGNLQSWVATRQGRFNVIPGYKPGTIPSDPVKAQKRIAFAIAKSQLVNNKRKPKKWKAKNIGEFIRIYRADVEKIFAEQSAHEIKTALAA